MGNPFVHIELSTDDVARAKDFYGSIFDWKFSEMPGMPGYPTYTLIDFGKPDAGGVMMPKQMAGQPTAWLGYVAVDSVKKTVAKARAAGANVVLDYMAIGKDGEHGACGVFLDPTGGAIGVWEMSAKAKAEQKAAAKKAAADKKAADKTAARTAAAAAKAAPKKAAPKKAAPKMAAPKKAAPKKAKKKGGKR